MENMDKGLNVPKSVCPSPKILDFNGKKASSGVHTPCMCNRTVGIGAIAPFLNKKIRKLEFGKT